jgi:hypothetical protein
MPTGYTAAVVDGTITELAPFALQLARGMSALVMMRDDPWDKPIPERFEPSPYHWEQLDAVTKERDRLLALSDAEAENEARAAFDAALAEKERYLAAKAEQRERYLAMILKVQAWEGAPDGLKDFALQQLNEGMRFDCDVGDGSYWPEPELVSGPTWRSRALAKVEQQIGYHATKCGEERQRVDERNAWVAQLRKSLGVDAAQ